MFWEKIRPRRLTQEEMTPKLDYAAGLDEIQRPITVFLKNHGFRRQGRTYNRTNADGLIHVVNFQAGAYPLGGYEIEGLRSNVWGRFAVNLGVVVPQLYAVRSHNAAPKKFHRESDAGWHTRLGNLIEGKDTWWPIAEPFAAVAATTQSQLERFALPFFAHLPDHRSIVEWADKRKVFPGMPEGGSAILAAVAAHQCGEPAKAAIFFERARENARAEPHPATREARLAHIDEMEARVLSGQR